MLSVSPQVIYVACTSVDDASVDDDPKKGQPKRWEMHGVGEKRGKYMTRKGRNMHLGPLGWKHTKRRESSCTLKTNNFNVA